MAENKKKFTTFVKSLIFEEDKTPTKPVETSESEATTQTPSNVIPNQPSAFGTTTSVSSVINNPTSGNGGIQGIRKDVGNPLWGAVEGKDYFVISIGKRLK